jgi:hypothetical protein
MAEQTGCGRSAAEVAKEDENRDKMQTSANEQEKEEHIMQARVGAHAPDFKTEFYFKGKFGEFKLSDHLGSWIMLCFYPGDFTFV